MLHLEPTNPENSIRFPEAIEPSYPPRDNSDDGEHVSEDESEAVNAVAEETLRQISGKIDIGSDGTAAASIADGTTTSEVDKQRILGQIFKKLPEKAVGVSENASGIEASNDHTYTTSRARSQKAQTHRYKLVSKNPIDISLMLVCHETYNEAFAFFYQGLHFVLDCDGTSALRFLESLPPLGLRRIANIVLTSTVLSDDDATSFLAWSPNGTEAPYIRYPPMATPFGAYLALAMPGLSHVSLYMPYGGNEKMCCARAPIDIGTLLAYGRIKRMSLVFSGEQAATTIRQDSQTTSYEALVGRLQDMEKKIARQGFGLMVPMPRSRDCAKGWGKLCEAFVQTCAAEFVWNYGERDVDMGSDGNVQAVVDFVLDGKSMQRKTVELFSTLTDS